MYDRPRGAGASTLGIELNVARKAIARRSVPVNSTSKV
jgi:hypothetical protein